jgi:hypothetical protein
MVGMTRAGATIELGRPDEETDSAASELVVTITLKLGSGPASPEAMRLTELLERFVAGEDETPSTTVAMQDDPDVVTVFADARTGAGPRNSR